MENYPLTPEERAEIERLEALCHEQEIEIQHLEREQQKLQAKIDEYKKIFYGEQR